MSLMRFTLFMTVWCTICPLKAFADVFSFPEKDFHVRMSLESPNYTIDFQPDDFEAVTVRFQPNVSQVVGLAGSYRGLFGLSWGIKTGSQNENLAAFGNTEYDDFRFNFAFHQFLVSVIYSQFKGFYIENSADVDPAWNETLPHVQYPDMYLRNTEINFAWVLKPSQFSMPGVFSQTERQEGNGGSWIIGGDLGQTVFSNTGGMIPNQVRGPYGPGGNISEARFTSAVIKGGYGYAWADRWFFGTYLLGGAALTKRKLEFINASGLNGWDVNFNVNLLMSGGYNGDDFFWGLLADSRADTFRGAGLIMGVTIMNISLFFGGHF